MVRYVSAAYAALLWGNYIASNVAALVDAIETWVEHWNDDPKPFVWHKTASEIVAKVRRGRAALAEVKSATDD